MTKTNSNRVLVVGGGVVGICCALELLSEGYRVTLDDSTRIDVAPATLVFAICGQCPAFPNVRNQRGPGTIDESRDG